MFRGEGRGDEYAENSRNAAIPGIVSRGKPIGFHLFLIKFETRAPLLSLLSRREEKRDVDNRRITITFQRSRITSSRKLLVKSYSNDKLIKFLRDGYRD